MVLVEYIEIWNRKDTACERTSQVEVRVGNFEINPLSTMSEQKKQLQKNKVCGEWRHTATCEQRITISCGVDVPGSWVTIEIKDPKVKQMNIAEVRVYGKSMRSKLISYTT